MLSVCQSRLNFVQANLAQIRKISHNVQAWAVYYEIEKSCIPGKFVHIMSQIS